MSKIVLFGDAKYADECYFYFTNDSEHDVVGFTVDAAYQTKKELFGLPVVPFEEVSEKFPPGKFDMFIALGYQVLNRLRKRKYDEAKAKGYKLVSYVSSRAANVGKVPIGDNCLILENNSIQPCSKIGDNVTLWSNNIVGHHSTIGDHCYIAGGVVVSGTTTIGDYSFLGVHATIGQGISIGERNVIGAGCVITKSTEPGSVYIQPDSPKFRLDSEHFMKITKIER